MTRVKKSRKVGKIGVSKTETTRKVKKTEFSKSTNTAGNKAGSRQQSASNNASGAHDKENQDVRVGSKKSIDLNKYQSPSAPTKVPVKTDGTTPQQELDAIEQDSKLEQLLEKQDSNKLSSTEQAYVSRMLKRHKELCEQLGVDMADEQTQHETDPFAQLDAIRLDDFKD